MLESIVRICSLLGTQSVAEAVRHGRLRRIGHLERMRRDDWVSGCRKKKCRGGWEIGVGRGRKT